jgi:hypothetical protein
MEQNYHVEVMVGSKAGAGESRVKEKRRTHAAEGASSKSQGQGQSQPAGRLRPVWPSAFEDEKGAPCEGARAGCKGHRAVRVDRSAGTLRQAGPGYHGRSFTSGLEAPGYDCAEVCACSRTLHFRARARPNGARPISHESPGTRANRDAAALRSAPRCGDRAGYNLQKSPLIAESIKKLSGDRSLSRYEHSWSTSPECFISLAP